MKHKIADEDKVTRLPDIDAGRVEAVIIGPTVAEATSRLAPSGVVLLVPIVALVPVAPLEPVVPIVETVPEGTVGPLTNLLVPVWPSKVIPLPLLVVVAPPLRLPVLVPMTVVPVWVATGCPLMVLTVVEVRPPNGFDWVSVSLDLVKVTGLPFVPVEVNDTVLDVSWLPFRLLETKLTDFTGLTN